MRQFVLIAALSGFCLVSLLLGAPWLPVLVIFLTLGAIIELFVPEKL